MKVLPTLFGVLVALSIASGIDEGQTFENGIGVYVYKSIAPYNDHIKNFIEQNNGAHYYVQSYYNAMYWNAIGTIDLRRLRMRLDTANGKKRIACISLGILTGKATADIGIENEGDGWFPFFYSHKWDVGMETFGYQKEKYEDVERVTFSIDAKVSRSKDYLIGHFNFWGGDYDELLGKERLVFSRPRGELYTTDSQGNPRLRFVRFMSLLPYAADNTAEKDVADFSYMRNARFTGLQLYHREYGYQAWNMDRIAHAWSVQTANIENLRIASRDSGMDTFSVYHSHDYHK